MKKRMLLPFVLLAGFMLTISSCGALAGENLMAGIKPMKQAIPGNQENKELTESLSGFSLGMFQTAIKAKQTGNVLLSPLSAYFALSMTLNGADGNTAEEMKSTLEMGGLSLESLNNGVSGWMNALSQEDAKAKWSIANSIWYNEGFQVDGKFLQTNADYYLADARMLDFSSASAPGTINGWVKEKTDGKIDEIVTSIQPDVVMYLINAVWFKADWMTPFKTSGTQPGTFHTPSADAMVKFLSRTGSITYLKNAICEGILLPYSDKRFAYAALMPLGSQSPRQMIADMAPSDLSNLLKSGTEKQISLRMPKFETQYETDLVDPLRQMGMKAAFIPDGADFSLMNADRSKNLYISGIRQKTYCRVDEKGTEAAAATSVEMTTTAMPLSDMELVFDKPFLYGIFDVETGVPMFLGLMENPK